MFMKHIGSKLSGVAALAVVASAVTFSQQAMAGCGQYPGLEKMAYTPAENGFFKLHESSARFYKVAYEESSDSSQKTAPIVGLWHFVYLSKDNDALMIPEGTPVDGGNTTWFGDGNEETSSEMRDPATGSICLGIWKQTGDQTYELNHIGLSWDPVAKKAAGPAFIKQYVELDKIGDKYTGLATITQYLPDGKTIATVLINKVEVPLVIHAWIVAYRVNLDTSKQTPILPKI